MMLLKFAEVEEKVQSALDMFMEKDKVLLKIDVSEKAITHKLAEALLYQFPDWNVDCEYNRDGIDDPKSMPDTFRKYKKNGKEGCVIPDVIIHKRLTNKNLLVVEAKKSCSDKIDEDRDKLKEYMNGKLRYNYGLLLILTVGSMPNLELEWI